MIWALLSSGLLALAATIWLTGVYRNAAIKQGIIDIPDHRSSHTLPTPTGGGVVAVIAILCLWLVAFFAGLLTIREAIALILPGGLLATIGFLDDRQHLSKRWRFGAQVVAVTGVLTLLHPLPELPLWPGMALDLNHWAVLPLVGLAMIWLVNLYNFMDGIDGLAGGEAVTVLGGIALILAVTGNTNTALLLAITAVPMIGFLHWNWPPAKIFMGDACSTFLGLSFGTLALITSKDGQITPWVWVIMLSAFWVDATYTLVTRIVTGQDWRSPHRSHLYQKLASKTQSHTKVSSACILFNATVLLPLASLSLTGNNATLLAQSAAALFIVAGCMWAKAGLSS